MVDASEATLARVSFDAIDESVVRQAVDAPNCGAVALFFGIVRNHDGGQEVRSLDYSSHPDSEAFLAQVVIEEQKRTGLRMAAWHRVGSLQIGDAALVAAAASAHRREAFEAIECLVERIKREVPIWKRQHYVDGDSGWVGL